MANGVAHSKAGEFCQVLLGKIGLTRGISSQQSGISDNTQ